MSAIWNPDRPPIEYLERRIKYYKKKISSVKKSVNNEWLIRKYTKEALVKAVADAIIHYEQRKSDFEKAVQVLKKNIGNK